ncbi:MAG: hypothetical protein JWM10_3112, partial [Myxococcaceae bacterium]|nr:hypothetical protein [Myxococcaceae bacterium]
MEPTAVRPRTHALLVGIDAYHSGVKALTGCVNDIDAIEALLVERLGLAPERVTRLTAPPKAGTGGRAPTRANLLAELDRLGGADVAAGDRVFIYYSGHGASVEVADGDARSTREALVPVDATGLDGVGTNLVFDVELNRRLARLAATGAHVTFVLDSCHSGGATRDASDEAGARSISLRSAVLSEALDPANALDESAAGGRSLGAVADVVVVAACAADELALECADGDLRQHGLLTQTLLQALAGVPDEALPDLLWGRIWRRLLAEVEGRRPQHPSLTGSFGRPVFGGPSRDADTGIGVTRVGTRNEYELDHGTLSGLAVGAKVAVYGSAPLRFPALGSPDDLAARVGTLEVTEATRSFAVAKVAAGGAAFALTDGARARLVDPGAAGRLAVAMIPAPAQGDPLAALVDASTLVRVVAEGQVAAARVLRLDDGTLVITDDAQGTPADGAEPYLVAIAPEDQARTAAVLEHYVRYSAPLRLADACTDLPGALRLELLDCRDAPPDPESPGYRLFPSVEPGGRGLAPLAASAEGFIELAHRDRVGVRVVNASPERLKVAIVHCASNGAVSLQGELVLAPRSTELVWCDGRIGRPFALQIDHDPLLRRGRAGRSVEVSHLVAIGTSDVGRSFAHLSTGDLTFAAARDRTRGPGGFGAPQPEEPLELWTAARVKLRVRRPKPSTRGMGASEEPDEPAPLPSIESLFAVPHYALVIGIDDYAAPFARLSGAVDDATAVAAVLADPARTDRFEVTLLTDAAATLEGIKAAFAELWGKVAAEPAARVVLYFAGHGVSAVAPDEVDATTPGYFLPHDAVHGARQNWLAMADAQRAINALGCHHLLLVLDCCFAGAFRWFATRAASPSDRPLFEERVRRYLHDPAWHVITSAAHDEEALDALDGTLLLAGRRPRDVAAADGTGARSPFARALVMALRGDADLALPRENDPDGVITGSEIQVYIRACFDRWQDQMERPLQHPLFFHWPARSDKGEFVFLNPDPAVPVKLAPAIALIAANNPYRGLAPHTHDPARPYFFGRDALARALVAMVTTEPVVVVHGASGAGKSSLVFAGALPALAAAGW